MPLTEEQAKTRLKRLTAWDAAPLALSEAEITDLLNDARRRDAAGKKPGETGYVPTWDLNAAAAAGWELKQAKAASLYDFTAGTAESYSRSQLMRHCEQMRRHFAGYTTGSIPIQGQTAGQSTWRPAGGWVHPDDLEPDGEDIFVPVLP